LTAAVGLDLSLTSSGLARITWGPGTVVTETWHRGVGGLTTITDPAERCRVLHGLKTDIVDWVAPCDLVVVEKLVPNPASRSTNERAALWYLVVSALVSRGVRVAELHPSTLKVYATGRGDAKKPDMRAAARAAWPEVVTSCSDEDDALWLAGVGVHLLDGPLPYPVTEQRGSVIANMRASPSAA
jgi:Holliday junction resolvasome RuvABC endonuclease subunit